MTFCADWFPPPGIPTAGVGHAVLVVDDEPVVRDVARHCLTELGYRVFEADGQAEAVAVLEAAKIDLVLLDVVMPGRNGVEIAELIRRRWPDPGIVFMSAHSDRVLLEHGLGAGQCALLEKPFTCQELVAATERALDRRHQPHRRVGLLRGRASGMAPPTPDESDR
jgi:two-component system cell cycle sensor histidine kinase/response regulator CckA